MHLKIKTRVQYSILKTVMVMCMFFTGSWMLINTIFHQEDYHIIIAISWLFMLTMIVITQVSGLSMGANCKICVMLGYFIRVLLALWGTFGHGSLYSFLIYGDQVGFYESAVNLYRNVDTKVITKFPLMLEYILKIGGTNRLIPQLTNIACWFIGIIIIDSFGKMNVNRRLMNIIVAFYSLVPWSLYYSVTVHRETIMCFLIMVSYFYFLRWMSTGYTNDFMLSFLISLVAIILHAGNIFVWVSYFVIWVFWDIKKQRWCRSKNKELLLLFIIVFAVPIYNYVLVRLVGSYFPSRLTLDVFTSKIYMTGRTNYLPSNIPINNIFDAGGWTIIRSFFFWFSPVPWQWSSIMDPIGFFMDVFPWLFLLGYIIKHVVRRQCDARAFSIIPMLLTYTFVYGWGTINAGTAGRHKCVMVGAVCIAALLATKCKGAGFRTKMIRASCII